MAPAVSQPAAYEPILLHVLKPYKPLLLARLPTARAIHRRGAQRAATMESYLERMRQSKSRPEVDGKLVQSVGTLSRYLLFPEEYGTRFVVRPDVPQAELLRVTDWSRLTPEDYDRECFHVEFDVSGTSLDGYPMGKALSVYASNPADQVDAFLSKMGLDPLQTLSGEWLAPQDDPDAMVVTTVGKLFTQYLDVFGKPSRDFLKALYPYARDIQEKVKIAELTLDRKVTDFQLRQACGQTYADYLLEFPSARPPLEKYMDLIPTIKQRVYSICSSSDYRPGKIQLLVVREDWETKDKQLRYGLCSNYLDLLGTSSCIIGHLTHSVMEMPEDKEAPIFMAGLGTGLAPFRAFIEQRVAEKSKGHAVGPMYLFFGGRHAHAEYYYRDEMEEFERTGMVQCHNAWSRDTPGKKVYVQNKITEQADILWQHLGKPGSGGYFFLCGSKQPEKDVQAAVLSIFQSTGGLSKAGAEARMEELAQTGRYVTEVY